MERKNKKNRLVPAYKRFILLLFVCAFFFSSPLTTPKAHALWPDIPGFTYKQMLEDIRDRIKGIVMGMLKQQAIGAITQQMDSLIAGKGSGGPKIITNWEDYLIKTPENNTKIYMNDYLSRITSGRGSSSTYKSEGFGGFAGGQVLGASSSGGSGGYASQLVAMAKQNTTEKKDPKLTYEGDPSQMFAGGNFKNFNQYLSGVNNPWAFDVNAQKEFAKKTGEEKKVAETKAKAYLGGIGAGEGPNGKGQITLPGSVIVQQKANVMDLGNKVLAAATHPEEVVTAMVSKIMTQAMQQGISMVQSKINSELGNLTKSMNPADFYKSNLPSSVKNGSSGSPTPTPTSPIITIPSGTTGTGSIPPPKRNF